MGQVGQADSTDVLHGRLNIYLAIPVLKQCVNSTQQNGFSKDSACMYIIWCMKLHGTGAAWSKDLNFSGFC